MSLRKKSGFTDFARKYGWIFLACALAIVMTFLIEEQDPADPAADAPSTSVEEAVSTPSDGTGGQAEKKELDTTPAVLGGIGAIVVYYVGCRIFDRKNKK